eukprot:6175068-Pleurochrysis_carterae.AAC.4
MAAARSALIPSQVPSICALLICLVLAQKKYRRLQMASNQNAHSTMLAWLKDGCCKCSPATGRQAV